jgi:hypothetical protein
MTVRIKTMSGLAEANAFLAGGIIGGKGLSGKTYGLHGLTLVFTSPAAATVTFATPGASAQEGLTLAEIVTQINAVIAGLAKVHDSRIHLQGSASVIFTGASTAAAMLGLPSAFVGVLYNPPDGAAPRILDMDAAALSGGTYILLLEE